MDCEVNLLNNVITFSSIDQLVYRKFQHFDNFAEKFRSTSSRVLFSSNDNLNQKGGPCLA